MLSCLKKAKPVALVIGATGLQGGSVARALEGKYKIRTLTRDASKPKAKELVARGYEVIEGSIADAAAVAKALEDAELVFLVTQFWEHFSAEKEYEEGKVFLDAVAAAPAKPKYFFFSTLENVTKETDGAITGVHHFDGKGRLTDYCRARGIDAVFVKLAMYLDNFLGLLTPQPQEDGSVAFTLPAMSKANLVAVGDTGAFIKAMIPRYSQLVNKEVPLVSDLLPFEDVCATFSRVIGRAVKYNPVPADVFAGFGFPGAADLADMFKWYEHPKCDRDPKLCRELYAGCLTAEKWAAANKDAMIKAWFKKE